ncbi:type III polyketide synthase [Geobacter sp. SVR]|uniref:type III polyketide synthase n=1 Tax=Geobacter sp. SVR TaxID=2495594 RepID=UPI00143EF737|nr:type III polyketide synthase [Geobacter sp. SVR]BCS53580.1 chalcone synthase [Geobacter sp. SVR]GCF84223.1 chalcone synthase [Geobacter sp. SVR]
MSKNCPVHIGSIACVVPPVSAGQDLAAELIREHYAPHLTQRSLGLIRAAFSHPAIRKRHFAVQELSDIMHESPDQRMERFTGQSVALAARAVTEALDKAGLSLDDVKGLVVNTCTGYLCPGISSYLVEKLGFSRTIGIYDLVGSGCGGAIPNLQVSEALLRSQPDGAVVSVSVEICSAAFQMDNDLSLILSNALFGDGAAAAVLWTRPQGFELVSSAGRYVPEQRDAVRFVHKQGQLHNQLSTELPGMVGAAAAQVVGELLASQGIAEGDIAHWALHTGGVKIIEAVRDRIGIPEEKLQPTRRMLAEYGNMSSPTVWFVLNDIAQNGVLPGDWCLMLAYGAGLSAHACLLRKV